MWIEEAADAFAEVAVEGTAAVSKVSVLFLVEIEKFDCEETSGGCLTGVESMNGS